MTDHETAAAIARCREALESDDMFSIATRDDFARLLEAYDELAAAKETDR